MIVKMVLYDKDEAEHCVQRLYDCDFASMSSSTGKKEMGLVRLSGCGRLGDVCIEVHKPTTTVFFLGRDGQTVDRYWGP